MIIDHHPRFKNSKDFLTWYDDVTKWDDEVDYNDYSHTTKSLKDWFFGDEGNHSTVEWTIRSCR
jgi:hypothetical protein